MPLFTFFCNEDKLISEIVSKTFGQIIFTIPIPRQFNYDSDKIKIITKLANRVVSILIVLCL